MQSENKKGFLEKKYANNWLKLLNLIRFYVDFILPYKLHKLYNYVYQFKQNVLWTFRLKLPLLYQLN